MLLPGVQGKVQGIEWFFAALEGLFVIPGLILSFLGTSSWLDSQTSGEGSQ